MNLADNREQIRSIVAGVEGIGVIHDYDRWAAEWPKFLDRCKDANGRINTCMFRRVKMEKRTITIGQNKERIHIFAFRVIMGLNDAQATGLLFDDLLTRIETAFDGHKTLNGTCRSISPEWGPMAGASGMQLETSEERFFGGVLCHYGELHLAVVERNNL